MEKLSKMFEHIKLSTDKDMLEDKQEVKEEKQEVQEQEEHKDYKELAEKAVLARHLLRKEKMSEKEEEFIKTVEAIELTEEEREKVREEISKMYEDDNMDYSDQFGTLKILAENFLEKKFSDEEFNELMSKVIMGREGATPEIMEDLQNEIEAFFVAIENAIGGGE